MSNETLDQLTALTLPALPTDLLPILRPSVGVLESITFGNLLALLPFRGYIDGLTLSTAGASSVFGIAAGQAADRTNTVVMNLLSAFTKTTAAWVAGAGNGALDTGAIANNTWYHVYLIERLDTGATDILLSLSGISPTLPANYTLYRRIGAMKTDGAAHWLGFVQFGDVFTWTVPVVSVNGVSPPVSGGANTVTLAVPPAVQVEAIFTASASYVSGATTELRFYPTFGTAVPVVADLYAPSTVPITAGQFRLMTNTSAQIISNMIFGGLTTTYSVEVDGWIDQRGRG